MPTAVETLRVPAHHRYVLARFVADLEAELSDNLYSVLLYGSAVRGSFNPDHSDLNVLIVLEASTPEAHRVISECIGRTRVEIDPFVLTRPGFERSARAFAIKFDSIGRHYAVLSGADPIAGLSLDRDTAWFLCEQAVRNLRLRSVQTYIHSRRNGRRYMRYLEHVVPPMLTYLSEIQRLKGKDIPDDYVARLPVLAEAFELPLENLQQLIELRDESRVLSVSQIEATHRILYGLLDTVVSWMAAHE